MKNKIGIYKIISPSGKVYFGQSIQIEKRWKFYYGNNNKNQPKLYNSFIKYGPENHKFEIVEECSIEELELKEGFYKQHFIDKFGWEMALFCQINDRNGGIKSKETREKMSISQIKNLSKPEVKEKRKINCKIAANRPGVQEKAINNTDWLSRNKKLLKPILQYDMDGNFIKEWDSLKDIQYFNKDKKWWSTEIGLSIKTQKSKYGFIWKYK